ncbi:protein Dok-7 isoform X3 [Astyanax mexicanus]|uniref:protein Dok-7 isoform X3 n=1 Tax=Astyanax mexicanus TaxID=7994 RepID=UPI0020CAC671|nr:protein Dok-7 isoform X3 [Astyanax mexicanus]
MTDSVVAEGHVKLRDGKKWKSRWVVLRKPSPVADCLVLHVSKERGAKEKSSVVLEHICGLEAGSSGEGVAFTLTILCLNQTVQLGFDSKDALLPWDLRLHYHLGEVHSFNVTVLPGTKLESGPATLHFCNSLLVIARDVPPVIIGQWNLLDLRRYGPVTNGFVFEGGTRCGYWAGVFFLSCAEGEQISFLFDCVVRGLSPSRGPFGLKPLLPEPSTTAASVEERLNHEAEELEKRLSLLSHSTASSFSSSVAGDDRSISGSSDNSDTSHSDSSIGSRLTLWAEPVPTTSTESSFTTASRIASHGEDKLSVNVAGVPRVPSKPSCSRRLQEIGRQGSSDSGIATGSHSSYSGSFSSYTGSLDIGSPKEEYGSLFSLPSLSNPEKHLCTCPTSHNHEYQVPSSLRYLYDTPRSLLEPPGSSVTVQSKEQSGAATKEPAGFTSRERTDETVKEQTEASAASFSIPNSPRESTLFLTHNHRPEGTQKVVQGCQGASCAETHSECLICSPPPAASRSLFTTCPVCGGLKKAPFPQSGSTLQPGVPDKKQRSHGERGRMDPSYEIMEGRATDRSSEVEEKSRYELMGSCGQQRSPQETEGVFVFPPEGSGVIDRPKGDTVTYVNIPVSPTSKKQLHYMELELQEHGTTIRGKGSTKYAQIDITATETAHRVGTQHALGREEGLQRLEQWRRGGAPQ